MSNYNFIICAVFKNEAHILDEWIKHYLNRGCDHIYLVDDDSTDDFSVITTKYTGSVTVFNNDIYTSSSNGRRLAIYNKYFKPLLSESRWMTILDLSDFLYNPNTLRLPDVIEKYDDYSQIIIDCLVFGSNGIKSQPDSVVDEFLKRGLFKGECEENIRAILRCADLLDFKKYEHDVCGDTAYVKYEEDGETVDFIINNYCVQSLQWFLKVKAIRGSLDKVGHSIKIDYFKKSDLNEKLDRRLCDQNKVIRRAAKSIRSFTPVEDLITDWTAE